MMSVYLNKSLENIECARFLHKSKKFYLPIPHISYYSSFQLLKHILIYCLDRDKKSLKEEQDYLQKGTHEFFSNAIYKELLERDNEIAFNFNNYLGQLKEFRNEADYEKRIFNPNECGLIISMADNLNKSLIAIFKINYE